MPCFHYQRAYRDKCGRSKETGRWSITHNPSQGYVDVPVIHRCGNCFGCRRDYFRGWAVRCVHEAQLHDRKCFVTLTYNDESLPPGGTLRLSDVQEFMRELRRKSGPGVKFYHCGEYGPKLQRPHYHMLLFGYDFSDASPFKVTPAGHILFRSAELESLWKHGFSTVEHLTLGNAAYTARYVMKKMRGKEASEAWYGDLKPEYSTGSMRPGIGHDWFLKYWKDVYPHDFVVFKNKKFRPPRYYDKLLEKYFPDVVPEVEAARREKGRLLSENNIPERLLVREYLAKKQYREKTTRSYEGEIESFQRF